jgi:hypothetical protein
MAENNTMDVSALLAQIEALKAQNATLSAKKKSAGITMKRGEKGGMCIYGLGRYPTHLYKSQADVLFTDENVAKVRAWLLENGHTLATKG